MAGKRLARLCAATGLAVALALGAATSLASRVGESPAELRISRPRLRPGPTPEGYALLVRADDGDAHRTNTRDAYAALRELGYPRDHIWVLAQDGRADDIYPIDGPVTRDAVVAALGEIRRVAGPEDLFVLYLNGHASEAWGRSASAGRAAIPPSAQLHLKDSMLDDVVLASQLGTIPATKLCLLGMCYSGDAADAIRREPGKGEYLAIASAIPGKESQGDLGDAIDGNVFRAYLATNRRAADTNRDGRVDAAEAFSYATRRHMAAHALRFRFQVVAPPYLTSSAPPREFSLAYPSQRAP